LNCSQCSFTGTAERGFMVGHGSETTPMWCWKKGHLRDHLMVALPSEGPFPHSLCRGICFLGQERAAGHLEQCGEDPNVPGGERRGCECSWGGTEGTYVQRQWRPPEPSPRATRDRGSKESKAKPSSAGLGFFLPLGTEPWLFTVLSVSQFTHFISYLYLYL